MSISLSTFVHGALQVGEMVPGVGIVAKLADTALSMTGHEIGGTPNAAPPASASGSPIPALVAGGSVLAAAGVGAAVAHHYLSRRKAARRRPRARAVIRRLASPRRGRRKGKGMPAGLRRYLAAVRSGKVKRGQKMAKGR